MLEESIPGRIDIVEGFVPRSACSQSTRQEALVANSFRQGYVHRPAVTGVINSDGSTSNSAEFLALGLRGMDLSVVAFPANNQMTLFAVTSTITP